MASMRSEGMLMLKSTKGLRELHTLRLHRICLSAGVW